MNKIEQALLNADDLAISEEVDCSNVLWYIGELNKEKEQVRKETAKEILSKISKYLKLFSYIHKYAEEAKNAEIEFIDGEKGELQSVWDVITLHKNEQADYETMNQLEDNIGNIEKSRLLKEFEKDFKRFAEKYGVEVDETVNEGMFF